MHWRTRNKKINYRENKGENKLVDLVYCTNHDRYKNVKFTCDTYPGGGLSRKIWIGHKQLRETQMIKLIWKLKYKRR